MANKNGICWRDFFTGFVSGVALILIFTVFMLPNMVKDVIGTNQTSKADSEEATEEDTSADLKMYVTDKKEWAITTDDGATFNFHTPEGWYSLDDQYNDGLIQYYGMDLPSDGIACVGDAKDQYDATFIINARPMSDVKTVLQTIYGEDYSDEEMLYSDTYLYMKDGTEPEGSTIEELDSIVADGHTWRVFKHGYDTEYYTDETQSETETVHTDELLAYSDGDDTVEVIMFMAEFNQENGIAKLKEFLGAE